MTRARYETPEYRRALAQWEAIIRHRSTYCHALICKVGDRTIPQGAPRNSWDLGHDEYDRDRISGPNHRRCNRAEGASYGNRQRPILAGRRPPGPRHCEICGQQYKATYSKQRTCGRACGVVLQRRHRPPTPSTERTTETRTCTECRASFTVHPDNNRRTCSQPCSYKRHRRRARQRYHGAVAVNAW